MMKLESTTPLVTAVAAINRNHKNRGMSRVKKVKLNEMKNGLLISKNHGKKGPKKILSGTKKKLNV